MHVLIIKLNLKLPPEVVYYNLSDSNYFCFLDSSLKKNKYSKFSYIAFDPFFAIKSKSFAGIANTNSYPKFILILSQS